MGLGSLAHQILNWDLQNAETSFGIKIFLKVNGIQRFNLSDQQKLW